MSKYTTEVRYICETLAGLDESVGYEDVNNVITVAAPKVFNFDFPIFDESYRLPLEIKILRHFYTREIGMETVGLWKLKLQDKLTLVMPYYNEMYKSALLEFNPFYDVDLTRDHQRIDNGNNENTETKSGEKSGTRTVSDDVATATNGTDTVKDTRTVSKNVSDVLDGTTTKGSTDVLDGTTTKGTTDVIDGTKVTSGSNDNTRTDNLTQNKTTTLGAVKTETDDGKTKWDLYSDTPQGGINGIEQATDSVSNNAYLTNARKIIESGAHRVTSSGGDSETTTNTGTQKNQGTNTENVKDDSTRTISDNIKEDSERTVNENVKDDVERTLTENDTDELNGKKTTLVTGTNNRDIQEESTENESANVKNVGTIHNVEDYLEHVKGKNGGVSYSKLLKEYRETFLNIDQMLLDELNDLFYMLW